MLQEDTVTVGRRTVFLKECLAHGASIKSPIVRAEGTSQKGKLRHREGKGLGWGPADREGLEPRTPGPRASPIAMGCSLYSPLGSFAD